MHDAFSPRNPNHSDLSDPPCYKRTLILLIQRQENSPAVIELAFDGVECFHLEPSGEEYDGSIFRGEFHWTGGSVWWADTTAFDPENPPYGQQFSWVRARSARWRIRDAWLGDSLIYDPEAPAPLTNADRS